MLRQNLKTVRGWLEEESSQASKYVWYNAMHMVCILDVQVSRHHNMTWACLCRAGQKEVKKISEEVKPKDTSH